MGIIDAKFGSEIVTKKGKVYKFDDIGCMVRWMKSGELELSALQHILVMNYEKENDLLDVHSCVFVVGPDIKSPMNFNTAAFATNDAANQFASNPGRKLLDWKIIYDTID
jgi:copper chaperone NosL